MEAKIIQEKKNSIVIQIEIPTTGTMLQAEEIIQKAVNSVGLEATNYKLSQFDTDGSPITIDDQKLTSKGKVPKAYQTPFGETIIERHVYQGNQGGVTYCPLENDAKIIVGSTPKFSKIVSSKYSDIGSSRVQVDLEKNHGRYISRTYIQSISDAVAQIISEKHYNWNYTIPIEPKLVKTIGISLDGTCMYIVKDGWRQAMVGTISLYNEDGIRLYTHYTASSPEYGKETFYKEFEVDINRVCSKYSNATCIGIADGAKDNWTFIEKFTSLQILDYFHATEYLTRISESAFKRKWEGKEWLEKACHQLKHEKDGAKELEGQMHTFLKKKITSKKKEAIQASITYFKNHMHQMDYSDYQEKKYPIGSGVIEAACKVIIKQRLCNSGMKWTESGAKSILNLRCFNYSSGKWEQYWKKIDRYGVN